MKLPFAAGLKRLGLVFLLMNWALSSPAQNGSDPYKFKPKAHETNKKLAASAYEANLKKHKGDSNVLVLPGLVADKQTQRVEVMVEATGLAENAACEFSIIGEKSEHAYEALMIAFAEPSAVHQALQFIGAKPGLPIDPESLRFWARGGCFNLTVIREKQPPVRLEKLLLDRRTGRPLPEAGFRFVGAKVVPDTKDVRKTVYSADIYQPISVVSLFNSPSSVLEIYGKMDKSEAYQNIVVNPVQSLAEGEILTLAIQPADPSGMIQARDLVLQAGLAKTTSASSGTGLQRLNSIVFQLKDGETVLNQKPDLGSVFAALTPMDRKWFECFLTLNLGEDLDLASIDPLAQIMASIDSERGVRIEPPGPGQLYYRAFLPPEELLDRAARFYHPWELALSEKEGAVSGRLLRINSKYKGDGSKPVLEATETAVANARELRARLDAYAEQVKQGAQPSNPPMIMVYAPGTLRYGQLTRFLELALPTHKTIYVYVDKTMSPVAAKSP